ncbi:MAG: hypothetical protein ACD_4C00238G0005 [uncultured bacterium (gcode 4)]|uniref:Oxidized purine nucleoside triphosphate hydrolase n=1 Tax=uncultured bacterium (gcode 4) TaxID=1234023 RepID=K2F678_9BACT|nr:MAG: hypothetical protein ACD_4C00238G0005 [uncultured bacterium (gcode 4)]
MKQTTFAYLFNSEGQILLCMKKRWFWVGKWNWPGGKVDQNETTRQWAKRELQEETWINIPEEKLEFKGLLHFFYDWKPDWDQDTNVFIYKWYDWEFCETEEMLPKWYDIKDIPYDNMWIDDKIWLPVLINEEDFEFTFKFWEDWKIKEYQRHK